jgi:hypothetical protein
MIGSMSVLLYTCSCTDTQTCPHISAYSATYWVSAPDSRINTWWQWHIEFLRERQYKFVRPIPVIKEHLPPREIPVVRAKIERRMFTPRVKPLQRRNS